MMAEDNSNHVEMLLNAIENPKPNIDENHPNHRWTGNQGRFSQSLDRRIDLGFGHICPQPDVTWQCTWRLRWRKPSVGYCCQSIQPDDSVTASDRLDAFL